MRGKLGVYLWGLWAVAAVAFGACMIAYSMATTATRGELELRPGATVRLELYRIQEAPLWMHALLPLPAPAAPGAERPAAPGGIVGHGSEMRAGDLLMLRLRGPQGQDLQLDGSFVDAFSNRHAMRELRPMIALEGGKRVLPPAVKLPAGNSVLELTVTDVADSLLGKQAEVLVHPPYMLKRVAPGYEWVRWLLLWPVYGLVLALWAVAMLWLTVRARRRRQRTAGA